MTGRLDEAIGAYRLWTEMYPQDWMPYHNLGDIARRMGRFDEALKHLEQARLLKPDQIMTDQALANTYMNMGRFAEAREMIRQAQSRGRDAYFNHVILLQLAIVDGGVEQVRKEFASVSGAVNDSSVVQVAARAEAFAGNLPAARSLIARAVTNARSGQMNDVAASLVAEQGLDAALAGDAGYARRAVDRALAISRGSKTLFASSLASALAGRPTVAEQLAEEYLRVTPPATDVVAVSGPVLQAAAALAGGKPQRAIEALQSTVGYERIGRFWPAYLRGLAYLRLNQPREAAAQFEAIPTHRGDSTASMLIPLASLELGRARRALGDNRGARDAFDRFINLWQTDGANQPLLAAAVRERARLPR